ncbi:MAG: histidine--tRNA ligase [Flavobacteriales bacterium CG18_big_fil_WC_8_21_14_2_50_32_9]|nr:MAG: histidine--tRNA ligase [Flavobacteriales bacterium CG18_big_fil_WC_8_21_14_2_50_32_9]
MSNKPSIPKGTRDFSPIEMARRNYIFDTIKKVYKKYGFQQIETPAMENLNTLVGTGGDESDKLIFKILNSGDYLAKADEKALQEKNSNGLTKSIAEKALHYDLTVPFARYVVQNQNDITFPFRRFQIQPVWRADRPQKGRYREFYQCDADIIGSDSLLNEVDLIKIIDDVFTELFQGKLNYTVSINNRKILQGIVESVGEQDKFEQIVVAIDKYDKIGLEGVFKELKDMNIPEENSLTLMDLLAIREGGKIIEVNNNKDLFKLMFNQLGFLSQKIGNTINGQKGIEELEFVFEKLEKLGLKTANVKFDPTLARGLGYYTGTIIEVKVDNFPSICGGGRYDDLTGKFGLKDVSGVGISFGADRIYDVLLDNNLYPKFEGDSTQVLFVNFGEKEQDYCLPLLFQLRDAGINSEIYPDNAKMQKQMKFANNKNINYVVMVGSDEMASGKLTVKNMLTGTQEALTISELIEKCMNL